MLDTLTLNIADDWHCHLRDSNALALTTKHAARQFARVIVMPNLDTPITTVRQAEAYHARILNAMPDHESFTPLMTLYLTDNTSLDELQRAAESELIHAVKLYPAGATTNSRAGIQSLDGLKPQLEALTELRLPLLIHGEVNDPLVDIFDREASFIERYLNHWSDAYPDLKIVLEHISSKAACDFVTKARNGVAATITAHHLLINRNDLLVGGIKPHHYCLPIVKRRTDQQALLKAATSGSPKFFLGTDSAPHTAQSKQSACGCAGIYTAHAALELYASAFDAVGALDKLPDFASRFGAAFYGLAQNQSTCTLVRREQLIPKEYPFQDDSVIPFAAGQSLAWTLQPSSSQE